MAPAAADRETVVRRHVHANHILVAELYRPSVKNAFDDNMYLQLIETIEFYQRDTSLHALVITGHGDYFTSGADISKAMANTNDRGEVVLPSKGVAKQYMHAMLECPKLVVAAVNGPAVGIGVTLLLHCDFVYATPQATFWTPFMRIGIVPEFASSFTFPHQLGQLLANQMLIQSKRIDADRALAGGLVGQIVPKQGAEFLSQVFADLAPMVSDPASAKNLPVYKDMTRRERLPLVREALVHEYKELDRRFLSGETFEAAQKLFAMVKASKKAKL